MFRSGVLFLLAALLAFPAMGRAEEGGFFTLWPLVDYRYAPDVEYSSLHVLGPLLKFERKKREYELAARPFFFRAADDAGASFQEILYPVSSSKKEPDQASFQVLKLLNSDFGASDKGSDNEFMVFPFVFYGQDENRGNYFALFPFGGKIYNHFWRDEIRFALFPLYGRTLKDQTVTTNYLWPFGATIEGPGEAGLKVWPFYGRSEKIGVYRKRFYLWPVFSRYDLKLDSDNPVHHRAAFPFYIAEDSPLQSTRTVLWPFFSHIENREKNYEEWNFPLPLVRVTRGDYKHGNRFLPFWADETIGSNRKRWFLWPIYKIEQTSTEVIERRRDRILYFLYSDLEETVKKQGTPRKERVSLWPLFTYQKIDGVSHFHTLSLLEPFLPESLGVERNWSPLWRFYQVKWDGQGNEVSTFLWNLYWKERRGDDLALEVFPFVTYLDKSESGRDVSFLKGLFRYRSGEQGRRINLLYLPWAIPLG